MVPVPTSTTERISRLDERFEASSRQLDQPSDRPVGRPLRRELQLADGSNRIRVELYMDDGTTWWPILEAHKATIEDALGADLVWEPLEESKASRVAMYFDGVDPDDRAAWPTYRNWAIDKLGDFRAALQPIVASGVASSQSTPVVPAPQPPVSLS